MKKDTYDLSRLLCSSISREIPEEYNNLDRDRKKEKIKELLEDDLDLFDEVIMEIRKEKIEKIRNK